MPWFMTSCASNIDAHPADHWPAPAASGVFVFTIAAQFPLQSAASPSVAESVDKAGKVEQVRETAKGALLAQDDLWIRWRHVGPLRRNRPDRLVVCLKQETDAVAGVACRRRRAVDR
jgi:hypothetical protein